MAVKYWSKIFRKEVMERHYGSGGGFFLRGEALGLVFRWKKKKQTAYAQKHI